MLHNQPGSRVAGRHANFPSQFFDRGVIFVEDVSDLFEQVGDSLVANAVYDVLVYFSRSPRTIGRSYRRKCEYGQSCWCAGDA
jgi:hypothetical protein